MTFYADLGPIDYFRSSGSPSWRAVGWLGEGKPFSQGQVSDAFVKRLGALMQRFEQPFFFMGAHACELCPASGPRASGQYNLWVPGNGVIYVVPYLIQHYIHEHHYRPPDEFLDAVLRCPDTDTSEYRAAMSAIDPHFGHEAPGG